MIRFGALGDLVLTLPALEALSHHGESVDFLCRERYASLLRPLPWIRRLWTLPEGSSLSALRALSRELKSEHYERVFDLHGNLRSRSLRLMMSGSGSRWQESPRDSIYRRLLVLSPEALRPALRRRPFLPVAERHLLLLEKEGYREVPEPRPLYPLSETLLEEARCRLDAADFPVDCPPLALAPSAAWPSKIWPHFGRLLEILPDSLPILLLGGLAEREICESLSARARQKTLSVTSEEDLSRVAALLSCSRALVSADSGLAHLSEALGRPSLVLFGPTVPQFGFPPRLPGSVLMEKELPCRPCSLHGKKPCKKTQRDCLEGIPAEALRDALLEGGLL